MTKIETLNIRLNPEKIVDKEVLDYLDQSLIPKTTLVRTVSIHKTERLKASEGPYVKNNLKASETPGNKPESPVSSKGRLRGGFSVFSDKGIQVTGFNRKPAEYTGPGKITGRWTLCQTKINLVTG